MTTTSFRAHKNGTDQTSVSDNTDTQVTFGTEVFDNGGFFASSAWTPPAGRVLLGASVLQTGTIAANLFSSLTIRRDSTPIAYLQQKNITNLGGNICWAWDTASGTNVYTVWNQVDVTSGTATFSGAVQNTTFWGVWFATEANAGFFNYNPPLRGFLRPHKGNLQG